MQRDDVTEVFTRHGPVRGKTRTAEGERGQAMECSPDEKTETLLPHWVVVVTSSDVTRALTRRHTHTHMLQYTIAQSHSLVTKENARKKASLPSSSPTKKKREEKHFQAGINHVRRPRNGEETSRGAALRHWLHDAVTSRTRPHARGPKRRHFSK